MSSFPIFQSMIERMVKVSETSEGYDEDEEDDCRAGEPA